MNVCTHAIPNWTIPPPWHPHKEQREVNKQRPQCVGANTVIGDDFTTDGTLTLTVKNSLCVLRMSALLSFFHIRVASCLVFTCQKWCTPPSAGVEHYLVSFIFPFLPLSLSWMKETTVTAHVSVFSMDLCPHFCRSAKIQMLGFSTVYIHRWVTQGVLIQGIKPPPFLFFSGLFPM